MKKKVIIIALVTMLVGCGLPSGYNQEVYDICSKALEAMDGYNDGDLTYDEARNKLGKLTEQLVLIEDMDADHNSPEYKAWSANMKITTFRLAMGLDKLGEEKTADLLDAANRLREDLGK